MQRAIQPVSIMRCTLSFGASCNRGAIIPLLAWLLCVASVGLVSADPLAWEVVNETFVPSNSSSDASSSFEQVSFAGTAYVAKIKASAHELNWLYNNENTSDNTFTIDLRLTGSAGATGSFYVTSLMTYSWDITSVGINAQAEQNFDLSINGVSRYQISKYHDSVGGSETGTNKDTLEEFRSYPVTLTVGDHLLLEGRVKAHAHGVALTLSDVDSTAENRIGVHSVPEHVNTASLAAGALLGVAALRWSHRAMRRTRVRRQILSHENDDGAYPDFWDSACVG